MNRRRFLRAAAAAGVLSTGAVRSDEARRPAATGSDGGAGAGTAGGRDSDVAPRGSACGDRSVTDRASGRLSAGGEHRYGYGLRTTDPCRLVVSLAGPTGADFDLYLTLDGRRPTPADHDYRSRAPGGDERIAVEDPDAASPRVLVAAYDGRGDYELAVEERGTGTVEGGLARESPVTATDTNDPPRASLLADRTVLAPGETLSVTADGSDPDGSVAAHDWAFGDGTTATGETAGHSYDSAGRYELRLTATDDDGAGTTVTETVTVTESPVVEETTTLSGDLAGPGDRARHEYATRTTAPREVVLSLSGDGSRDFDLYVTADGRRPTVRDFDARAWSYEDGEDVTLRGTEGTLGVMVDAWEGRGAYEVTVTERGAGAEGTCGGAVAAERRLGSVPGGDGERLTYRPRTDDPCLVVATLQGPADADLDLYAAVDGSPSPTDHDAAARTIGSRERLAVAPSGAVELLVEGWRGGGDYVLDLREFGT